MASSRNQVRKRLIPYFAIFSKVAMQLSPFPVCNFRYFDYATPVLLEQDIYSTIYVSNIAEDIARDIEQEQEEHLKNDYKHRMAVNRSLCIGILKSDLDLHYSGKGSPNPRFIVPESV